ncbi:MAG TPA: adenylate/guanylate cyclase domain-containing protein [Pyrinomonadaceae bacterium]|nr:adenylate/guanylate cyclase domain-containing protein [Pyrinomonadaceae bacterium]
MSNSAEQSAVFTFNYIDYQLRERLDEAVAYVNALSKEEVLQCNDDCLQRIIARFAISDVRLRSHDRTIDEETVELVDHTFDRKTGDTGHQVLIPFDGDPDWLIEIDHQKAPDDGFPIAFLDKKRRQIYIKCRLSATDTEDELKRNVDYRTRLAEQYVMLVAEKLANFNSELAIEMTNDLERRREAIQKAKRARDMLGLPQVNNPRNREIREKMERLNQELMKRMSASGKTDRISDAPALYTMHVLFMDIVGYSKLPVDRQTSMLRLLQDIVQQTREFALGIENECLIAIPTGDGMALAFLGDPLAPVKCAIEVSGRIRNSPDLTLRMGLNIGPAYITKDINRHQNLAGDGINIAQRVMDCGDEGHILVSKRVDDLSCLSGWSQYLSDLGEVEVKHGKRIHIFNLYSADFGNAAHPSKLSDSRRT